MKIENIKINGFAGIENKEINFEDGINIIYGENEKGKSTVLKFILGMFYGLSKNKNGKEIPDIEKYKPWKLEDFSGKIKYKLNNEEIFEVFRKFNKKNPKIFNNNGEDISKQFSIDKNKGNNFFEEQTGITEEIFLSTNAITQEEIKLNKQEQNNLIQKITNMVSSGSDNVSYKKAIEKLNKKIIEEVGTDRSVGRPLNIVEEKIEQTNKEKAILETATLKIEDIENKIKNEKTESELIENKIKFIKKIKEEKEREKLEEEKIETNNKIKNEIKEKIEKLKNEKEKIKEENFEKNKKINIFIIVLFIANIIVLLISLKNKIIIFSEIAIETVLILIYLKNKLKLNKIKNKNKIKTEEKEKIKKGIEILEENKNKTEEKINEIKNKNLFEKENNEKEIKKEFKNKIEDEFLNNNIQKNYNQMNFILSELETENSNLKINLKTIEIEKNNAEKMQEKIIEKEEELENLKEQKEELQILGESIQIAKEELEKAYNSMKENVTPKFSKKLSEIIEKVSNGKYKKVIFNDEEGLKVELENGDYITPYWLSTGTIDQMYLSLRIAGLEEITKEEMPLILDEAFAYYDEKRLSNVLEYLSEEYKNKQIILLTCTKRETEILNKLNKKYNLIEL